MRFYGLNRTYCDVCHEMRELLDKSSHLESNKKVFGSLIEELQTMGSRMESALTDAKDIKHLYKERSKLLKQVKVLEEKSKEIKFVMDMDNVKESNDDDIVVEDW